MYNKSSGYRLSKPRKVYGQYTPGRETKHYDYTQNYELGNVTTQKLQLVNAIDQGVTDQTRIGDKLSASKVFIKTYIELKETGKKNSFRQICFVWKENSTPGVGDIIQDTSIDVNRIISPLKWDNINKFTIFSDKTYFLDSTTGAHNDNKETGFFTVNKYWKKGMRVQYEESNSIPISNKIYILTIHSSSTVGDEIQVNQAFRFQFKG